MKRATIRDLAAKADVSISTVNRVLGGASNVSPATIERVRDAAAAIGFYGLRSIEGRIAAARTRYRFGFLLQQPTRPFYRILGDALKAGAERVQDADVVVKVDFLEELAPQNIAACMLALATECDAV